MENKPDERQMEEELSNRDVSKESISPKHLIDSSEPLAEPQPFRGETDPDEAMSRTISRRQSLIERVQSRLSFFNHSLKEQRLRLGIKFLFIYVLMGVLTLGIFSIYWGASYKRNDRVKNFDMLVVMGDTETIDGVDPVIGNTLTQVLESPTAKRYGTWHIRSYQDILELGKHHNNNSVEQEIARIIHHQKYWSSIYVKPNASYNLLEAIQQGNSGYNVTNNTIVLIYETGRDFLNMAQYVHPSLLAVEKMWLASQANVSLALFKHMDNASDVLADASSLKLATTPLTFSYHDLIPYTNPVLVAPNQVGLIYMIILTFFQVGFFSDVHMVVEQKFNLRRKHYIGYRLLSSTLSYFVLSLFFSFVSLAMQVDFTMAFGRSGFLVYWMVCFLTFAAVGLANEVMAMILITIYPPLVGYWLIFWVLVNISPTFAPFELLPGVFRYGYAMPIHASSELSKVIFFNTWKGKMGYNFAILISWVLVQYVSLPFWIVWFQKTMMKKKQKAVAKEAAKAANEAA